MISIITYKLIVDLINHSQEIGEDISLNLSQMGNDLNNSQIDSNNIHKKLLYNEINNTYDSLNLIHNNYSKELLYFVKQLQLYIINNYGSVNNFLRDNSETVYRYFADISETTGYLIDSDLITTPQGECPKENPSKEIIS